MEKLFKKSEQSQQSTYQAKSRFTLLIYFRDGYTKGMKFHSFKHDQRKFNGTYIKDERYSLNRLVWLIEEKFKGTYKTGIIYCNETGRELIKYSYDFLKDCVNFEWCYEQSGNIVMSIKENPVPKMTTERKSEFARYKF